MALHEIIRANSGEPNISAIMASAAKVGIAVQLATATTFELADGTKPLAGFLTREVTTDGPTVSDHFWSAAAPTPEGKWLEFPEKAGNSVSAQSGLALEVEGGDYINVVSNSASKITSETTVGTRLSFTDGKFCVAQANQHAEFVLVAADLTPEVTGNLRISVTRLAGQKIPAS